MDSQPRCCERARQIRDRDDHGTHVIRAFLMLFPIEPEPNPGSLSAHIEKQQTSMSALPLFDLMVMMECFSLVAWGTIIGNTFSLRHSARLASICEDGISERLKQALHPGHLEVENWLAPEKVYHCPEKPRGTPIDHSNDEAKRYQDFNKA